MKETKAGLEAKFKMADETVGVLRAKTVELESDVRMWKGRYEQTEANRSTLRADLEKLRAEKDAVYGEDWSRARTHEYHLAEELRQAILRLGMLRGALIIATSKAKTDEVDPAGAMAV